MMVNLHDARKDQAVHLWAQAANICGQFERKHGHSAIREIHAGAAQSGLVIECGPGSDVVGDIGDVDLQLEVAVVEAADGDGVVEVTGGFAVDGHDGKVAELVPSVDFRGVNDRFDGLSRRQDFGWKAMGEMKFADDDFDINAEVVLVAENLDHFAAGVLRGAGPVSDFDVDDNIFEIIPVGAASDFIAEDAIRIVLPLCSLCPL